MNNSSTHDERIAKMTFALVYPMYVAKVEKKGRTTAELHQVIGWLIGFDKAQMQYLIDKNISFDAFFQHDSLNPNAKLITGKICGCCIEEIENPIIQKVRYLDKLVNELANGKKLDKILRN